MQPFCYNDGMNMVMLAILFGALGLILGSFAGAQVWRLRARQLRDDKKHKETYDKSEYKTLKVLLQKGGKDRSRCLQCGHVLAWRDLVPLVSWCLTGGKCQYCRKPIGWFEPLIEVLLALAFVVSYLLWPWQLAGSGWILFALWLISLVVLAMLVAYDAKWKLLPDILNGIYAVLALAFVAVRYFIVGDVQGWSLLGSLGIMAGIYFVLSIVSKGAWIGEGDVKLGVGLGLVLANWQAAFIALFLANFIGCIAVLPGLVSKKLKPTSEIPFGPLFVLGTFISFFASRAIIAWLFTVTIF